MTTALYVLAAILMLCILVTVHEAGHFLAARLTGIPVKEFSIGFGPKLISWKSKKYETRFFLRLILVGGYCMFYGEDDVEEKEKDDPRALGNYPVWKRFITVLAGPLMNLVLALAVAAVLFGIVGEDVGDYGYAEVKVVEENSPAAKAGLREGDLLISVNGQDAAGLAPEDAPKALKNLSMLSYLVNTCQPDVTIGVQRGGKTLTIKITPQYDEARKLYLLGVQSELQHTPVYASVGPFRAVKLGAEYCVYAGGVILGGLRDLVTTTEGIKNSAGPVGTVQVIAERTQEAARSSAQDAWITYGELLLVISVNLGLFNLLPVPALDGCRLIFLLIEAVRRKPLSKKAEAYINLGGFVVVMGLILVLTFMDIMRIIQ